MKKFIKSLVIAGGIVFSAAGVASCGGDSAGTGLSFESFAFSATADGADSDSLRNQLDDFDGRWNVSTEGVLPTALGKGDIKELRDSLYGLANIREEDGKLKLVLPPELVPEGDKDAKGEKNQPKGDPKSEMINQLDIDLLTPGLAVFHDYLYTYPEGAAHGMHANRYLNYDIKAGEIITLNRLFTAGFEKLLLPAIRTKLKESGLDLIVEEDEIGMPRQFRVTRSGVEFIYGLYEIAPYASGEPSVTFYFSELSSILTPKGKALLLGVE